MNAIQSPSTWGATHEVFNQAPALEDYNLYSADCVLAEAVAREGGAWAEERLSSFGKLVGSREVIELGFKANMNPPVLRTHDRFGNRIDQVDFHPAWHELMKIAVRNELHCLPWSYPGKGAHVARAALMFLACQIEAGHGCPISMTYSAYPVLKKQSHLAADWLSKISSSTYDQRFLPLAAKDGAIVGMGMTEKQGGSDVRANTTIAWPLSHGGTEYQITGHKWFCSAPMSDAFLILAQAPGGLSCFLLPRWTPDLKPNNFFIQRLKEKLGNRSNASCEVEFQNSHALLIGEEGKGVLTIIDMVNHTRLDCTIMGAALVRQAVAQAVHHCRHRKAFGKRLVDQGLMQNVLADLSVESEAATILALRLARAYDESDLEGPFRRITTAIAKYWLGKRAPACVAEALECLGGNGYVEESVMPRLYREAPLGSIWEGSGNVICLDVRRAIEREPESFEALIKEIELGRGAESRLDTFIAALKRDLSRYLRHEWSCRSLVEKLALGLQASLLIRHAPPAVADAFCATRIAGDHGYAFGTIPEGMDSGCILERALL